MKASINEVLQSIPLYQQTFITPFPKEELFYEQAITSIPEKWYNCSTLLIIDTKENLEKLNNKQTANLIIQNSYLCAVVILHKEKNPLQDDIVRFYEQCQVPMIQIKNRDTITRFLNAPSSTFHYNNLSLELDGFYKRGFIDIAANLSMAFATPLLFLDENQQLLWQTGVNENDNRSLKWLQSYQQEISKNKGVKGRETLSSISSFELYIIDIAGQTNITLIASRDLVDWQKKIINKFIGFTAVLFQREEAFREQNDRYKEFFIYELLYRKFESQNILITRGKIWGWNLEKPHYLLVLEIETASEDFNDDIDVLDEVIRHLKTRKTELNKPSIVLPFQGDVVVLVEDEQNSLIRPKTATSNIAHWIESELAEFYPELIIYIGIGKWYNDTINLNKSYQEAKTAIQFGKVWFHHKQIYHMSDLGVIHLLSNIEHDVLLDFYEEKLSPIIESDKKYDTEYFLTLKLYFQYHGVIKDVSEVLFIHPNTLRKRMNKIESLIGFDRQNLEQLLSIMLAIKIYYSFS